MSNPGLVSRKLIRLSGNIGLNYTILLRVCRSRGDSDDRIGNEEVGKEAEFVVLDLRSTPLPAFRNSSTPATTLEKLADRAFSLIIMGDDRAVRATYILGELAYSKAD